jgi:glc operon protein GlcG
MYVAAAKRLTHRGAKQMAATTIAKAEQAGIAITVAIADARRASHPARTAMEGGFPVIVDGECIGGMGVSGGDRETDARIAKEAVASINAAWSLDGR